MRRTAQRLGSALVLASLGLLFFGFVVETPSGAIERPAIRWGIIGSLAGVLLHAAATWRPDPVSRSPDA